MPLYNTLLYGSGSLYSGPAFDTPIGLNYCRTDVDNLYEFYWTFTQGFFSPSITTFTYQLQVDSSPSFLAPVIYETEIETASVTLNGRSLSRALAATNIASSTLSVNLDSDGVQTVALAVNVSGAAIAADIQAKVRALTAANSLNQASYNTFTAVFNGVNNQYTLTSGSSGYNSAVVISGGTAAAALYLGLGNSGYEARGNTAILSKIPRRILIVESGSTSFLDVSGTTLAPAANQYVTSLPLGQLTFNSSNIPGTIKVTYVATTSADIVQFQRGNVGKAYTVLMNSRVDSEVPFYARVRIKEGVVYGPFSDTVTGYTLASAVRATADRLFTNLPDAHVYPLDERFKVTTARTTNLAKIYNAYANEFDREFLEKENTIRDVESDKTRDDRLFGIIGSRFSYPKPSAMEFVDYRFVVGAMKDAALLGGTYEAAKLVGRAFTGVDPTIVPISQTLNFFTADTSLTTENIVVGTGPYTASLSYAPGHDPIIPGSTISAAIASVSEPHTVPALSPYTVTLAARPWNIPSISGFAFTNNAPAAGQFSVDFLTGILTFNVANASAAVNVAYIPNPNVSGGTLSINIDGDGVQVVTLSAGLFVSKAAIAADIQAKVRALTAANPLNQASYTNFLALYSEATDKFTLVSGNQSPTATSSVVVSAGTAAIALALRLADGATQTTGLAYATPPAVPPAGKFSANFNGGNGSLLTFEGVAQALKVHTVLYPRADRIYSYIPGSITGSYTVPLLNPYTFTLGSLPANIPTIPGYSFTAAAPAVGQFTVAFSSGVVTFNAANAGAVVSISFVPQIPVLPTVYSSLAAGFGVKIILNNPAGFVLDKTNISFLLKQVLPAHTQFVLS